MKYPIGSRVDKTFGSKRYRGEVTRYANNDEWYHVVYEDGDEEDLDQTEMDDVVVVEKPRKIRVGGGRRRLGDPASAKKKTLTSERKTNGRRRSSIAARSDNKDKEETGERESEDETPAPKRPCVARKEPKHGTRALNQEEDEEDVEHEQENGDDQDDEDYEEEAPDKSVERRRGSEVEVEINVYMNALRQRREGKKVSYADQMEGGDDGEKEEDEEAVVNEEQDEMA